MKTLFEYTSKKRNNKILVTADEISTIDAYIDNKGGIKYVDKHYFNRWIETLEGLSKDRQNETFKETFIALKDKDSLNTHINNIDKANAHLFKETPMDKLRNELLKKENAKNFLANFKK